MEIKYTNDGKKVIIVGKLNTQDTIVQEIFIVNGNEIPSGENFVVTSLHDAPAVSWKENRLKSIEDSFENTKAEYERKLKQLTDSFNERKELISTHLEYAGKVLKNLNPECFDNLVSFLRGEINYFVVEEYSCPVIKSFKDVVLYKESDWGRIRWEGFKMITFFGKDDGKMDLRVNQYRDVSGSNGSVVHPFKTIEEAKEKLLDLTKECPYSETLIKELKKHNIPLDKQKVDEYKQKCIINAENSLKKAKDEVEKAKLSVKEIKSKNYEN